MEMAARVGEKSYENIREHPAVLAVEGAPLTGIEFFGPLDSGLLLQFAGMRLEVAPGTPISAFHGASPVVAGDLRAELYATSGSPVARVRIEHGRSLTLEFARGLTLSIALGGAPQGRLEAAAFFDESWRYEAY
jgi:hypothetical protein